MIEFFGNNLWLMWTLICVAFLILEVTSGDFFFMSFAIGAIGAAIGAALLSSLMAQIVVWAIITVLTLAFVRPFVLKYLHKKEANMKTNADALIGREGTVKEAIATGGKGYVAIDGDVWSAVSRETEPLPAGTRVRVVGRESIVVTVEKA